MLNNANTKIVLNNYILNLEKPALSHSKFKGNPARPHPSLITCLILCLFHINSPFNPPSFRRQHGLLPPNTRQVSLTWFLTLLRRNLISLVVRAVEQFLFRRIPRVNSTFLRAVAPNTYFHTRKSLYKLKEDKDHKLAWTEKKYWIYGVFCSLIRLSCSVSNSSDVILLTNFYNYLQVGKVSFSYFLLKFAKFPV